MLRLGFKTAYLDESAIIVHYAGLYATDMRNMGIDASIYDCVALQDESFWVRFLGKVKDKLQRHYDSYLCDWTMGSTSRCNSTSFREQYLKKIAYFCMLDH